MVSITQGSGLLKAQTTYLGLFNLEPGLCQSPALLIVCVLICHDGFEYHLVLDTLIAAYGSKLGGESHSHGGFILEEVM